MLLWIMKVFFGWPWCRHQWRTDEKLQWTTGEGGFRGYRMYQTCEKCGEVRTIDL
jgi:hypothetical protein